MCCRVEIRAKVMPELKSALHWRMFIIDKDDHPGLLPSEMPLPQKGTDHHNVQRWSPACRPVFISWHRSNT